MFKFKLNLIIIIHDLLKFVTQLLVSFQNVQIDKRIKFESQACIEYCKAEQKNDNNFYLKIFKESVDSNKKLKMH